METLYPPSLFSTCDNTCIPSPTANSSWLMIQEKSNGSCSKILWSKEENKNFERALAIYDDKDPDRWIKISLMTGKSIWDVMKQYKDLEDDVSDIEAGLVPIPSGYYHHHLKSSSSSSFTVEWVGNGSRSSSIFVNHDNDDEDLMCRRRPLSRPLEHERKKGIPWTEDEHRRFLLGLEKHGKGDWRNISRNFVISKTPTQVASHAQKFFLRQNSGGKDKRRPSIHDITTPNFITDTTATSTLTTTINIPLNKVMPYNKKPPQPSITSLLEYPSTSSSTLMIPDKIVLDWTSTSNNPPDDEEASLMVFNATTCSKSLPESQQLVTSVREQLVRQSNHVQSNFHHQGAETTSYQHQQLGSLINHTGSQCKAPSYKIHGRMMD